MARLAETQILTSAEPTRKSKAVQKSSFYAEWRSRYCPAPCLREETGAPSEKLLQAIWLHQRIKRNELATLDGQPVEILHPGFWNREPGPDFRAAVLRIGGDVVSKADVEIDLHSSGWKSHGHDVNPAFTNVALHVVWEGEVRSQRPTIAIKNFLDAPLTDLSLWIGGDGAETPSLAGQCGAPLKELNEQQLTELLKQAAFVRFQDKARHFQARARNGGWEQALWEGLFRALGYKHNVWPMQRLGGVARKTVARLPAHFPACSGAPAWGRGIAARRTRRRPPQQRGLRAPALGYLVARARHLLRSLDAESGVAFCRAASRESSAAPPCIGVALAREQEPGCGPRQMVFSKSSGFRVADLVAQFVQATDDFWPTHWTLRSAPLKQPQPLLGPPRLTDIAANVVLPWLWSRAVEGKNLLMREEIERRFYAWPAGEDNVVLKLARRRLLDTSMRKLKPRAALQQGLLQVVRDFCEHSNALCQNCRFPELVRAWPR